MLNEYYNNKNHLLGKKKITKKKISKNKILQEIQNKIELDKITPKNHSVLNKSPATIMESHWEY